jgi:hypothetical protein
MTTNVAETIAVQLGGVKRLTAMLGAHSFVGEKASLSFKIKARAKNGIKAVNIVLEPSDTYRVEFYSIHGYNVSKVAEHSGMYSDDLIALVETETGLALRL